MKFPQVANNVWLQAFGLGLWLFVAVIFVCAPFLFMLGVGSSAGDIDQRIQDTVQAQLASKIEQRNIPKPVVATVAALLNQPQLGLNYLTVRNADRVIMLSDGDLQDAPGWLPAQQAREWRGFFYRISSFDRSAALRVEGEIVAYIDYGIASGRVLAELSAWSWLVLLLTLAAGITLLWLFPIASSAIQARFSKSKDAEPVFKPQPKRVRANFQIADGDNELQLCDQMGMGYVAVDGQGTIVDVNVNAARLLGFELRRLAGQPLERLLVLEDTASARVDAPVIACLRGKQEPLQRRAWLRRRDGKLLGIEMHAAQIPASARVAAGMLFWEAGEAMNSQRQDAERAILAQRLTQHMGEAVVITTSAGQILESNEAARGLFGYSQQDFKKTSITNLLPSLNSEAGVQEMTQAAASAACRDGNTRSAVVSCMSLRWQNKPAFAFLIQADGAAGRASAQQSPHYPAGHPT